MHCRSKPSTLFTPCACQPLPSTCSEPVAFPSHHQCLLMQQSALIKMSSALTKWLSELQLAVLGRGGMGRPTAQGLLPCAKCVHTLHPGLARLQLHFHPDQMHIPVFAAPRVRASIFRACKPGVPAGAHFSSIYASDSLKSFVDILAVLKSMGALTQLQWLWDFS